MSWEERLDRLEAKNHELEKSLSKFKRGGALALVLMLSVFMMGTHESTSPPSGGSGGSGSSGGGSVKFKSVTAERFTLKDKNGKTRGVFTVQKDNSTTLFFYGSDGKIRIALNVLNDKGPNLAFFDLKGNLRSFFGVRSNGTPQLRFNAANRKARLRLSLSKSGSPSFSMYDEKNRSRIFMFVQGDVPLLTFTDSHGKLRAGIGLTRSEKGSVRILNAQGKIIRTLP